MEQPGNSEPTNKARNARRLGRTEGAFTTSRRSILNRLSKLSTSPARLRLRRAFFLADRRRHAHLQPRQSARGLLGKTRQPLLRRSGRHSRPALWLQSVGWVAAHRFLFADLRFHLLGWPAFLAPGAQMQECATAIGPVMDMFWGDRCGTIHDLDGNQWMIGTHIAEPTPQEMKKAMKQQMASAASGS